ncbi:MAG: serine/threonine protein kinase [Chloroflexi bacterium]|nr:serine/threonine protein kinase [Chloroflexota bacterium]
MNSKPSWIGYVLNGRYKIEEPLGQGGMSAVYRATDPNLRRTVAIKLIHSHLAADPEFVRRFEEEAAAVARLRHPNIIQVFDFNHDGNTYYMVLEYLPGYTLLEKLERANQQGQLLSLAETRDIMIPLCEAVAYAHQQGMIHRDLKPANVMINPHGQPVLMDFGIAKIVGGESMTATGGVIGTVAYMSPEQIRGERPDHRADLYALGIILYQMVTGRLPFQGENTAATMMQHLNTPVPDVRQFNRNTPPVLVNIIQKALAKDVSQRFQSAEELVFALRQIGMDAAATSVRSAPTVPTFTAPATGMQAPTGPMTGPVATPAKRPRWLIPAAAIVTLFTLLLCLTVAVVGGRELFGNTDPTATPTTFFVASAPTATTANDDQEEPTGASESDAAIATAAATATTAPTSAPINTSTTAPPQPTPSLVASPTLIATATTVPTNTPPPSPTVAPSPVATEGLRAEITGITVVDGRYSVSFQVFGYFSDTSSTHVHFFWNTIAPDQAGVPANPGNWKLYGSPSPFTGYAVSERPSGATQMCILVANPNHSVQLGTGNCINLP